MEFILRLLDMTANIIKPWYEDSKDLEQMANFVLRRLPDSFKDAEQAKFKIFFTTRDPSQRHFAGLCRKLDNAIQFRTGLQFIILIYKPYWEEKATNDEKFKVLIHELHHIQVIEKEDEETGEVKVIFKVRKHNEEEDFCELPSHDQYSETKLQELKASLSPIQAG